MTVFEHWRKRSGTYKESRLEAEHHQMRAGFERFTWGLLRMKMEVTQKEAANKLYSLRRTKRVCSVFQAWVDWSLFEKKDRELRMGRQKDMRLCREMLGSWKMWVRGIKLTRLVHAHHDTRFNESVGGHLAGERAKEEQLKEA